MPLHARNIRDKEKEVILTLPAAGASAVSAAIDLEQEQGGLIEEIAFQISVPVLPNLAASKNLTFTVQDSADGATFANLNPSIVATVAGSASGAAAASINFRLPVNARRYVAVSAAVDAAGGDNTAAQIVFRALF